MKRLTVLLLVLTLLVGCSAREPAQAAISFTDDLGRQVQLTAAPKRVACLLGSFAEVWMLAGGRVVAAPDDAWDDFGLAMEDAVNLGNTKQMSLEKLLSAEPDFVIASTNTRQDLQWLDTLEAAGIPTAYFNVSDFSDYLRMMRICTDITGRKDLYEQNGTAIQAQIDRAIALAQDRIAKDGAAPKVLFLRASATSIRAKNSKGNVTGQMLAALGCVNIADSDESLLENLSMEHILLQDPDLIFFVQSGDDASGTEAHIQRFFDENPIWQSLTAVQKGRVYRLDKRLYNLKPNALWGKAYLDLVEMIWE